MQRASQASADGSKDRARELYAAAAKTYPTSKEPWLKLAQDYFEVKNYGQAILAAQEVLQRDPADNVATSILAVSGLRVSAAGLSGLREQQRRINGDARTEAEDIVRVLRDLLGEPVLVPPVAGSSSRGAPAARPRAAAAGATGTAAGPSAAGAVRPKATAAAAAAPAASAARKADSPANPFNLLTK